MTRSSDVVALTNRHTQGEGDLRSSNGLVRNRGACAGAFDESVTCSRDAAFTGCLDTVTSMRLTVIGGAWRTIWLPSQTGPRVESAPVNRPSWPAEPHGWKCAPESHTPSNTGNTHRSFGSNKESTLCP